MRDQIVGALFLLAGCLVTYILCSLFEHWWEGR